LIDSPELVVTPVRSASGGQTAPPASDRDRREPPADVREPRGNFAEPHSAIVIYANYNFTKI
jgi:hypothetical protein